MVDIPTDHALTHPGEMLPEEFLLPIGLTQRELANAIHVPYQRINSNRQGCQERKEIFYAVRSTQ